MRRFSLLLSLSLATLCTLVSAIVGQPDGINKTTNPWWVPYKRRAQAGPDGPWNVMEITIDWPQQAVLFYPGGSESTLFINAKACENPQYPCPGNHSGLWQSVYNGDKNSRQVDAAKWDLTVQHPMRLSGTGAYTEHRITLHASQPYNYHLCTAFGKGACYFDSTAQFATKGMVANYPGGSKYSYTMDVGLLSLASSKTGLISWLAAAGFTVTLNQTISVGYKVGYYPSNSYGLHIGAARFHQDGSLWLGGYDQIRLISHPVTSSSTWVKLRKVGLGVDSGASPFYNAPSGQVNNLMAGNVPSKTINAYPNPAVPYIYLPAPVCRAAAKHLPVYFNSDLNLYIWDTTDPVYDKMMKSPSYMSFTFDSDSTESDRTIYVPMVLLNMSLTPPLAEKETPYFPCSPYSPSPDDKDNQYHLGRAFLQAALLSQNWGGKHSKSYTVLGQAPGPGFRSLGPQQPTKIRAGESKLQPYAPSTHWADTWANQLTALSADEATGSKPKPTDIPHPPSSISVPTQTGSTQTSSTPAQQSPPAGGLSASATAGIVLAVVVPILAIAGVATGFIVIRRRRRLQLEREQAAYMRKFGELDTGSDDDTLAAGTNSSAVPRLELAGGEAAHEMIATVELPGDAVVTPASPVDLEKPLPVAPPNTTDNSAVERSVERSMADILKGHLRWK